MAEQLTKYHLLCYARCVGQREKITDNDYDQCLLKQYAEVELLSEIESQIRNGVVLSIADIEVTYKNILEEYGSYEDLSVYYQRRYLKDLILGSISHAECVAQKDPSKPHLIQSSILDLTAAMDNAEKNGSDMRCIFKAANIVRKSILNFREGKPPITNDAEDVPPELFSFIKWVCTGSKREISQLGEHRRCSLEKEITSCISNIMYITKSDWQINHKSDQDFRTPTINENKMVIKTTLQIRHCCRSKKIVNALHANGVTMSNNRALQIETALANSVINSLHITPSGIDLFPFLQKDQFIYFDNTDFSIDTSDGKGQLHGGSHFCVSKWK